MLLKTFNYLEMLRYACSKHSTSWVSNPKQWDLDLQTGQSLTDALWTAGYAPASMVSSVFAPALVLIQDLHSKEELKALCRSSGYKDLR